MRASRPDAITVTFKGFNTHPGYAKGRMVNAIKLAADFDPRAARSRDLASPETTAGYRAICIRIRPMRRCDRTSVRLLVRDFVTAGLMRRKRSSSGSRGR